MGQARRPEAMQEMAAERAARDQASRVTERWNKAIAAGPRLL
jgi:hypothetical protein